MTCGGTGFASPSVVPPWDPSCPRFMSLGSLLVMLLMVSPHVPPAGGGLLQAPDATTMRCAVLQ